MLYGEILYGEIRETNSNFVYISHTEIYKNYPFNSFVFKDSLKQPFQLFFKYLSVYSTNG